MNPSFGVGIKISAVRHHLSWGLQMVFKHVQPVINKQNVITAPHRDQKKVQEIAPGSARTRIMRSSMKFPEAKTWANCSPSTGYATYIPHHHFKVWLQCSCKVPLFSPEQDAIGHSVQLSWTPMGIIYCIAKEVPI